MENVSKICESSEIFLFSNERKRDSSDAILRFILFAMARDKFLREQILNAPRAIKLEHKLNDPIWKRNWFLIFLYMRRDIKLWHHSIDNYFNVFLPLLFETLQSRNDLHFFHLIIKEGDMKSYFPWWMFCKALQIFSNFKWRYLCKSSIEVKMKTSKKNRY